MLGISFGELLICGVAAIVPLLAIVGVVALIRGTSQQTKMGINVNPPSACPKCGAGLPQIRAPKNLRQALWGGWTCINCNTELDKWGRVIP
ncbi:MAG: hypothetical protein QM817_32350 [Archangium sp.]